MRKLQTLVILGSMLCSFNALAQTNLTSYNKNLAFYNPAIQNLDYDQLYASGSYFTKPQAEEGENYLNYLAQVEYRASDMFRIGFHSSTVNTRLNKLDLHKLYASFSFEMEAGSKFMMGLEYGVMQDMTKLGEFNKVYSPTRYEFTDSISNTSDVGFGIAYSTEHLLVGVSVNRLNNPKLAPYPTQRWTLRTSPDTAYVKHDTSIVLGEDDFENAKVHANVNVAYTYDATETITICHNLLITNPSLQGTDFIGLQNHVTFNKKLAVGVGVFDNGNTGYMASLGYTFAEKLSFEVAAFFKEEFNFDPNAENPNYTYAFYNNRQYIVDAKGAYISSGLKPTVEACLRLTL